MTAVQQTRTPAVTVRLIRFLLMKLAKMHCSHALNHVKKRRHQLHRSTATKMPFNYLVLVQMSTLKMRQHHLQPTAGQHPRHLRMIAISINIKYIHGL
jgi:hypothetical protein